MTNFMRVSSKLFQRIVCTLFVAVVALATAGCTMVADSTLGSNLMPEEQVMVMKHLKYQGNNIIRINSDGTNKREVSGQRQELRRDTTVPHRLDTLVEYPVGIYGCAS